MSLDPNSLPITDQQVRRLKRDRKLLVRLLEALGRLLYGASYRIEGDACRCWKHRDRRPSGSIHLSRDGRAYLYTCHACDWNRLDPEEPKATGDVITVLRAALAGVGRPLDFEDAVRWLQRYREKAVDLEATAALPIFVQPQKPAPDPAMIAKARAQLPVAQEALRGNPRLQERLRNTRAVDFRTARRFGVGYSGDEPGGAYWIFPIFNGDGQLQVVKLHAVDSAVPKSFWFPKHAKQGQPLYPVDVQPSGPVWLCSGELKALAVISAGLAAISVTSGESVVQVTEELIRLLRHRTVALVADKDTAGIKWTTGMASVLLEKGIPSRRVDLGLQQPGADIADWVMRRRVVEQVSAEAVRAELLQRFAEAPQVGK